MAEVLQLPGTFDLADGKQVIGIFCTEPTEVNKKSWENWGFLVDFVVVDRNADVSFPRHCLIMVIKGKVQASTAWWAAKGMNSNGLEEKSAHLWSFGVALPILFAAEESLRNLILFQWRRLDDMTQLPNKAAIWPSEWASTDALSPISTELYTQFKEQVDGQNSCQYVACSANQTSTARLASTREPSHSITDVTSIHASAIGWPPIFSVHTGWVMSFNEASAASTWKTYR